MKLSELDYDLPPELIAAEPLTNRTEARLMKLSRATEASSHHIFSDIQQFLKSGDVLVLNDTKVIPARLLGKRKTGGQLEVFLVRQMNEYEWDALIKPSGRVKKGDELIFERDNQKVSFEVLDDPREGTGARRLKVTSDNFLDAIEAVGHVPLPPYIQREDRKQDVQDYQTVFAKEKGAVAAPTAGLHFDDALLGELKEKGVEIVTVTLHVSYGTFQPIQVEDIEEHQMFEESYSVSEEAAEVINQAKDAGRRVIACGTTSVRTLESAVDPRGRIVPGLGVTKLYVYPPYNFKIVDGLITNFHLPKSSLMLLVGAFLGECSKLMAAYQEAIKEHYRFYSYGDAMLID